MIIAATVLSVLLAGPASGSAPAWPDRHVTIEGSSTVAPYARVMGDFLQNGHNLTISRAGSGTGLSRLCSGDEGAPEIAASSRLIKKKELMACAEAGITSLLEQSIGRDGIVIAQYRKAQDMELSPRDLYLAAAHHYPRGDDDCILIKNENTRWKDVRSDLPDRQISLIGPPRTSGTRDTFISKILVEGARSYPCLAALEKSNPDFFHRATRVRLDSQWIDGGEEDEAIAMTLPYVREAVGIFGYAYLLNSEDLEAIPFDGVLPTNETIASGEYKLSRNLYLYTTPETYRKNRTVPEFLRGFGSFGAIGPEGVLTRIGLVSSGHPEPLIDVDTRDGTRSIARVKAAGPRGVGGH
ncbi:MAG: substrate-binding domain-containing protein [Pseudomonadota bacterium]